MTLAVSTVLPMVRSPDISEASAEAMRALGTRALTIRAEAAERGDLRTGLRPPPWPC